VEVPEVKASADDIAQVVRDIRGKGVLLWVSDGELHFKAAKGALTAADTQRLKTARNKIISLLGSGAGTAQAKPGVRERPDRAPLGLSQMSQWHSLQAGELAPYRSLSSATLIRGRLRLEAFRRAVADTILRHDALRTRIIVSDGVPMQVIDESLDYFVAIDDLTKVPPEWREMETRRAIEALVLQPADVRVSPLFDIRLLKFRDDEHVLILIVDHMIADGFSMGVLLRDILAAYARVVSGDAVLPKKPRQFADYAAWQRSELASWMARVGNARNARLRACGPLKFPTDSVAGNATGPEGGLVPLHIDGQLRSDLCDASRRLQSTMALTVFTAAAALVLCWCRAKEGVIRFQSDGRSTPDLAGSIGFFAAQLLIRVELRDEDRFVDLLETVTKEYCEAYAHVDFSYAASERSPPVFAPNVLFNWIPQRARIDSLMIAGTEDVLTCAPVRFTNPVLRAFGSDRQPLIKLVDEGDQISGFVSFPLKRYSVASMERFARNLHAFLRTLPVEPDRLIREIPLL
jgi:hypothetical protein